MKKRIKQTGLVSAVFCYVAASTMGQNPATGIAAAGYLTGAALLAACLADSFVEKVGKDEETDLGYCNYIGGYIGNRIPGRKRNRHPYRGRV